MSRKLQQKRLVEPRYSQERSMVMNDGEKLVIIGCGGVGGPAAMLSKKLMPGVDVTVIREEKRFIVR